MGSAYRTVPYKQKHNPGNLSVSDTAEDMQGVYPQVAPAIDVWGQKAVRGGGTAEQQLDYPIYKGGGQHRNAPDSPGQYPTPEGGHHWSLRALARQAVELGLVESWSHKTVRQYLKKHAQAASQSAVVYPQGEYQLRSPHGGHPGALRRTL